VILNPLPSLISRHRPLSLVSVQKRKGKQDEERDKRMIKEKQSPTRAGETKKIKTEDDEKRTSKRPCPLMCYLGCCKIAAAQLSFMPLQATQGRRRCFPSSSDALLTP
jgi:hypothetical protein